MAYEGPKAVSLRLTFSSALYRQVELAAKNAGKPIDSTIKSLLWIGLGALNLGAHRRDDAK